jgi:hypothetical protein
VSSSEGKLNFVLPYVRYALAVNVIVCVYSIAQALDEIRRLVAARFAYRSMSSYYFSLFLDQASTAHYLAPQSSCRPI